MKKKLSAKAKEPIRLRTKKLANGNLSLYLDYYRDGKREYEFLKLYLIPEKTKADKIQNEETLRTANAIKAQKIIAIQNEEHGFTIGNRAKVGFIEYMEAQAAMYEERGNISYARIVRSTINHLRKYMGDKITLKQVDKSYLLGYIDFLSTTGDRYNRPLSDATKALYFNVVVIALNRAVNDDLLQANPAHKIDAKDRPQAGEATKEHLSFDEVKALIATACKYDVVKQAFLFSCFCGLRYSDVKMLEWGKIQEVEDGKKQVEIQQQKTRKPIYLPLSNNAIQWLPERGTAKDTDKVFQFPHVSTVEKSLQRWAEDAGVNKHITFHVSRHTNATLMAYFGADALTLRDLLGHTNIKTTQIYIKIADESKRKAVNLIPEIQL